jgi:Cu+-exporting ATPase
MNSKREQSLSSSEIEQPSTVVPVQQPAARQESDVYTCPMHPEIVREGPGECPKCGMALEPMTVDPEDKESPELTDMSRRFRASAILTVPLVVVAMGEVVGLSFYGLASVRTRD